MLEELQQLYQEVILDHGRSPRNFRRPDHPSALAHGHNPMCGDTLTVFLSVDGDKTITDAAFIGKGCAISMASASLMTEVIRNKTPEEADKIFEAFHRLCTEDDATMSDVSAIAAEDAERLEVLAGVRQFPVRVKCATLAWHAMHAALHGEGETTTE
ncbi:MAG: SUF system NifU family Fe-S cluster assembly protein [Rhodospirillales bacterium]